MSDFEIKFGEWMDIASAPKDRRILLCLGEEIVAIGSWNQNAFGGPFWEDDGVEPMPFIIEPTHWQCLPLPPVSGLSFKVEALFVDPENKKTFWKEIQTFEKRKDAKRMVGKNKHGKWRIVEVLKSS